MRTDPALLDADELRALSRVSPWRSVGQGLMEWSWIALLIIAAKQIDSLALYPLWVILIGSRQHALAILMHDAAHGRCHPNRNWNDAIAELVFAWPLLTSMRVYRRTHLAHHQHLQTPLDADWRIWRHYSYYWFPKKRSAVIAEIAWFSLGLRTTELWRFLKYYANKDARPNALRKNTANVPDQFSVNLDRLRFVFYGVATVAVVASGAWQTVALYWFVPLLTALMGALYVRAIAEHFISEDGGPYSLACSRSMVYSLLERILVAPLNVGYHLEHHLYPSVPFYRLKELHRRLMREDVFRDQARITHGVSGVIRECESSLSTQGLWEKQLLRADAPVATANPAGTI